MSNLYSEKSPEKDLMGLLFGNNDSGEKRPNNEKCDIKKNLKSAVPERNLVLPSFNLAKNVPIQSSVKSVFQLQPKQNLTKQENKSEFRHFDHQPKNALNLPPNSKNLKIQMGDILFDNFSMASAWHEKPKSKEPKKQELEDLIFVTDKKPQRNPKIYQKIDLSYLHNSYSTPLDPEIQLILNNFLVNENLGTQSDNDTFTILFKSMYFELSRKINNGFAEWHKSYVIVNPDFADQEIYQILQLIEEHSEIILKALQLIFIIISKKSDFRLILLPFGDFIDFSRLNSNKVNRTVRIKCSVLKVFNLKLVVNEIDFKCQDCFKIFPKKFRDSMFEFPQKCPDGDCLSRLFVPIKKTAKTVLCQRIKVQELESSIKNPGLIQLEVQNDLVNEIICGDQIDVFGVLMPEQTREEVLNNKHIKTEGGSLYSTFVKVISLRFLQTIPQIAVEQDSVKIPGIGVRKSGRFSRIAQQNQPNKVTSNVENTIKKILSFDSQVNYGSFGHYFENIVAKESAFEVLVDSFCPQIDGNELMKSFLVLQLCSIDVFHILLIGGTGSGKTTILNFVDDLLGFGGKKKDIELFPKISKEPGSEFGIEPGRLTLCSNSVCCIDNLHIINKKTQERLIDVIDNRQIQIGKSCSYGSLDGNISLIGAASTTDKTFDNHLPIKDNCKVLSTLVAKFDIVVPLKNHNKKMINKISHQMLKQFNGKMSQKSADDVEFILKQGFTKFINDRILQAREKRISPISNPECLKAIINYIRNLPIPSISVEIANYLKEFYTELKKEYQASTSDINLKMWFILVKLCQTRARMDNRKSVAMTDADEIIEIVKELSKELFCQNNSIGNIPQKSKSKDNKTLSNPKKQRLFISTLTEIAKDVGNWIFDYNELKELAEGINLGVDDFQLFLDRLNMESVIFKKPNNRYELAKLN